jgi:hypothetical protein
MTHRRVDQGPADGTARVALPDGWVDVDARTDGGPAPGRTTGRTTGQVITPADWRPSHGLRPTMTVTVRPLGPEQIAARILAEAQASLAELLVVSIDPWRVRGSGAVGRRLVFAHTDGDMTLSTLVWVVTTAVGDVVVSAHAEALDLHRSDAAFAEAVAGIELPGAPATAAPSGTAELARRAEGLRWQDVAPRSDGLRAAMVADPDARILVEASVGGSGHRFDATLTGDQAAIAATPSPRRVAGQAPDDPDDAPVTVRLPVTRLALAVAQWLGIGPARTAAGDPVTVPISLVMHRLVDPSVPAPVGVDAATWQQPWFLWTLRSSATDSGLVMVDTGTSGQCAVMETDDERTTRFAPLSSYNVWLTLNWLISESLVA